MYGPEILSGNRSLKNLLRFQRQYFCVGKLYESQHKVSYISWFLHSSLLFAVSSIV
jgi:hypothetical protein